MIFKNKLLSGKRSHQFEFSGEVNSVFANSESKRRLPIVLFFKRYFLVLEAVQIGLNLALMLNDLFLDISKISLGSFGSNSCCIYFDVVINMTAKFHYYCKIAKKYWEKTKISLNYKENHELSLLVNEIESSVHGQQVLEQVFAEAETTKVGRGKTLKEVWQMDRIEFLKDQRKNGKSIFQIKFYSDSIISKLFSTLNGTILLNVHVYMKLENNASE